MGTDLFQVQKADVTWKGWYGDQNKDGEESDDEDYDDLDDFIVGNHVED